LRNGDHIRVQLVYDKLAGLPRQIAEYWCLFAATGISAYLAWFSARLAWVSYTTHDISQSADMTPLWIPQMAMVIGTAALAIAFLEDLILKVLRHERAVTMPAEMARVE
jgi:TRAP-type C4-dicarboxylate transport system permease small subunit